MTFPSLFRPLPVCLGVLYVCPPLGPFLRLPNYPTYIIPVTHRYTS